MAALFYCGQQASSLLLLRHQHKLLLTARHQRRAPAAALALLLLAWPPPLLPPCRHAPSACWVQGLSSRRCPAAAAHSAAAAVAVVEARCLLPEPLCLLRVQLSPSAVCAAQGMPVHLLLLLL